MKFELTILGCSSATPTSNRYPTAQVLNILERFFLIDCGEGTQMQMRKYKIKMQRINHIFISHLHGDHYFGLIGLISTMHLLGRKNPLNVYCHPDLEQIIRLQLKTSDTRLQYELKFIHFRYDESVRILDDKIFTVDTIILKHRIPCCGFLFREKKRLKSLRKDKLEEYDVPIAAMEGLRRGEDLITANGIIVPNAELTKEPLPPRAYAYCSDTAYNEDIIDQIRGVELLYHEATFTSQFSDRARETFHSTALHAASIAQKAEVGQLLIGHYSARYKDVAPLVEEARSLFPNTLPAVEGEVYTVG